MQTVAGKTRGDFTAEMHGSRNLPNLSRSGGNETEPVQVVVATDPAARIGHVITEYRPDLEHFEPDLRTGRKHS
jgi:hypothetical protein